MTHPDTEWLSSLFVTHLVGNSQGLDVGLAEAPEAPSPAYPYLVVTPLSPFLIDGALNDRNELQWLEWQVSSVGLTAQQALGGSEAAKVRILDTAVDFSASGYVTSGDWQLVPGPAFESEQSDQPPLFVSHDTYRIMVSPA